MQFVLIFGLSVIPAIILTEIIALLYNIFIGFPVGISIEKQKRYKTVKAERIIRYNGHYRKYEHDDWKKGKYWFKFEWEIDGKKYKRFIHTTEWAPGPYETFYYLNPKYAMPTPRELAKYRYEIQTILISWIIFLLFFMKYFNLL